MTWALYYSNVNLLLMSNYHLVYAIHRRVPPTQKTMKEILDVQSRLNSRCAWTHERLTLAPLGQPQRPQFTFPFVRPGLPKDMPAFGRETGTDFENAPSRWAARGSTKVRDNLFNAHLVVAFLRHVSRQFPDLVFELKDEGGFVLPGVVTIRGGSVNLERDWLNRERERALEMTGDPQAAASYVWAEAEALQGRFFLDAAASDYVEVPEIAALSASWEELHAMSLEGAAELVVDRVTSLAPAVVAA